MQVKFDHQKLNALCKHLDTHYIDAQRLPNYTLSITDRYESLFSHVSGYADIASKTKATMHHSYRIYSMTKPITSVAIMQLYERGLIRLTDPLSHFFPEFQDMSVYLGGPSSAMQTEPARHPITIKHLLTHTSGLTYGFNQTHPVELFYHTHNLDYVQHFQRDQWISDLARAPLLFNPGEKFSYGVSTDVLAFVIEKITDMPFDQYIQKHILSPLGMTHTTFKYDGSPDLFTSCYEYTKGDSLRLQDAYNDSTFSRTPRSFSGGGGLISTSGDYQLFVRMLLNDGSLNGTKILGSRTARYMRRNHLPNNLSIPELTTGSHSEDSYLGTGYGLGFSCRFDTTASGVIGSEGEFGWGGLASTAFWVDPVEEFAVVFMSQLIPASIYEVRSDLRQMIYAALN